MNIFIKTGLALAGYTLLKSMTKNQTVAVSTTAIILWLLSVREKAEAEELAKTVDEAKIKEAEAEAEAEEREKISRGRILGEEAPTFFKTAGEKIYIEYPGLHVWFPQKATDRVKDIIILDKEGKEVNISNLIDQYTGL